MAPAPSYRSRSWSTALQYTASSRRITIVGVKRASRSRPGNSVRLPCIRSPVLPRRPVAATLCIASRVIKLASTSLQAGLTQTSASRARKAIRPQRLPEEANCWFGFCPRHHSSTYPAIPAAPRWSEAHNLQCMAWTQRDKPSIQASTPQNSACQPNNVIGTQWKMSGEHIMC